MADERILYTEALRGANHPSDPDTLNRLALISHNNDGTPIHHGCLIYLTADQTIANNTETIVNWGSEYTDTDGLHSTVSNTSRITIPAALNGRYGVLTAFIKWNADNTGQRVIRIKKNGVTTFGLPGDRRQALGDSMALIVTPRVLLVTGDYFEVAVTHTQGGNLTILSTASGIYECFFALDVY